MTTWWFCLALLCSDPPPAGETLATQEGPAAEVVWRVVSRRYDLTGDGVADTVELGSGANETSVAIGDGSERAHPRRWTFVFPHDSSENGLCGSPRDADVRFETPVLPLEEWGCASGDAAGDCIVARKQQAWLARAAKKGMRGLRVESLECDAIHIYFDGREFGMWRR